MVTVRSLPKARYTTVVLIFAIYMVAFLLSGCQVKPTKVFQTVPTSSRQTGGPLAVTPQTVVLDARPAFDYSVSHINGSFNMRADEFLQRGEAFKGLFEKDLFFHTRRLARLGIGPETPVIVVGRGVQDEGEEGHLAWVLRYLGIKNVSYAHIDYFSQPMSQAEAPPRQNVALWKPNFEESLVIEQNQFLKSIAIPKTNPNAPVILDVRSEQEYLRRDPSQFSKLGPDVGGLNIPWTEFFDSQGIANKEVAGRLAQVGVSVQKEIIVISNQGKRSAAVTLALRDLGFTRARNFSGGFRQLVLDHRKVNRKNHKN